MRVWMVAGALAIGAACALPQLPEVDDPCATWADPGFYRLDVDGYDRKTLVEVPATAGPRPLVMALHGYGGTAAEFAGEVTTFREDGADAGYVVAFPQGSGVPGGSGWNAGSCCGTSGLGADDLGFLDAVLASLSERVCADKVLAFGHSNGSMMVNHWACHGADVDAVVGSSGPLLDDSCPGDPLPVTMVVGTDDDKVPAEGGGGNIGTAPFPAAKDAFEAWIARNGCEGDPVETTQGIVTTDTWSCAAPTRFITLQDWTHAFPGGQRVRPEGFDIEDVALDVLGEVVEAASGG